MFKFSEKFRFCRILTGHYNNHSRPIPDKSKEKIFPLIGLYCNYNFLVDN